MKFKIGDVLIDPRDGERVEVLSVAPLYYNVRILTSGDGGPGGEWGRAEVGLHTTRPVDEIDLNYRLDETYRVKTTLKLYGIQ